ncbi:hypothetical protein PMI12_01050 [Variovorax sp. CF313]|nr:hypothetical protein PMI12_01050 [Variovorax sp. CF313]
MALFPASALRPGVRKREVFGWAMYDFANSGYTTVVITAVFAAYFGGNQRIAILSTAVLFVAGLLLLLPIRMERGRAAALRSPA